MRVFKKILKITFMAIIFGVVYSFFFTTYEHFKVNKMINDFKKRASNEYVEVEITTINNYSYIRRYFEVPRVTSNELNDKNNVFYDEEKHKLGIDGDIFAHRISPFPDVPFVHQFVSYYFGGHSALLTYKDGNANFIEATGFPDFERESLFDYIFNKGNVPHDLTSVINKAQNNSWQTPSSYYKYFGQFYRPKYVGLRAVNHFTEMKNGDELYKKFVNTAIKKGNEKVDNERLYNFLFFLNMKNKYYCTDLMGRIYEEAYESVIKNNKEYHSKGYAKKMNDDGFITSVNDLILSRDTFMIFYVELKEEIVNGEKIVVENIYYLEDVK